MANILATGISFAPHLAAFDATVKQRIEGIDLTPLLMYIIDSTHVDALPYLAEQFHVMGIEGWELTQTEQERRDLIKRAIELHRYKGTPWAIKNAITSVGFTDPQVIEGVGFDYNGERTFNGTVNYAGGEWAVFRVKLELPEGRSLSAIEIERVRKLIFEYKNVRSHLADLTIVVSLQQTETLADDELSLLVGDSPTETLTYGLNYDGAGVYNSGYSFDQSNDPATITIEQGGFATTENF